MMRRLLLALSLALTSLGAAGCNEFHYYDIHLRYDDAMFATVTSTLVSRVRICHVYVTGADTKDFYLGGTCTNSSPTTNIGTFEFSTFADSGTLNFTIKTYVGTEFDSCMLGSGTKSYPATATTTTVDMPGGDDDLVINMRNPTVETTCPP
jgi:hypothetical protein